MVIYNTQDLIKWIEKLNHETHVSIKKNKLSQSDFWYYDDELGEICNKNYSFFQIKGLQVLKDNQVIDEQPIIIQEEIGYLGIICKQFEGEMYYLMQAKIEPGNINKIQISPTLQATKSNFTQKHGGRKPAYLEYFLNASQYNIIVDQIQSEQSSRFYKKRNRNIIIEVNDSIEVKDNFRWMSLSQIKELMKIDNCVNMDTRTVLSCLPLSITCSNERQKEIFRKRCNDEAFYRSVLGDESSNLLPELYQYMNNYKMLDDTSVRLVPLHTLQNWEMTDTSICCKKSNSFKVVYCDIEIDGREVQHWTQPLFEATGIATFALFTCVEKGIRKFLVRALPEVGCFDKIELGPSIQMEYIHNRPHTVVDKFFFERLKNEKGIIFDTLLSEEGGRFYCEQNRNLIIEIEKDELSDLPNDYFWVDYKTLNTLVQVNNCLNIQLRNLLSVLEW